MVVSHSCLKFCGGLSIHEFFMVIKMPCKGEKSSTWREIHPDGTLSAAVTALSSRLQKSAVRSVSERKSMEWFSIATSNRIPFVWQKV